MKICERYILKLLFIRFSTILLCTAIFGIFQEMTKGYLLAMCTFWQMMLILPLMLPFILFQFLPFIYFGALLLVHSELYLNNELISFKAIGLSNQKLMNIFLYFAVFVLLFFVFLGVIYPKANMLFFKQRNAFGAGNLLKSLKPLKINTIGKYKIFFNKIDRNGILHDVTVVYENTANTSNQQEKNLTKEQKKILFSKTMSFGYNESNELTIQCIDDVILTLNFEKNLAKNNLLEKKNNPEPEVITEKTKDSNNMSRYVIHAKQINILFDDFFKTKNNLILEYKQQLRQLDLFSLIKVKTDNKYQNKIKKIELHGRAVIYWFVILSITAVCCLFLKRQTNRSSSKTLTIIVVMICTLISLSRAFVLDGIINNNVMLLSYYSLFVIIYIISILNLKKSDSAK